MLIRHASVHVLSRSNSIVTLQSQGTPFRNGLFGNVYVGFRLFNQLVYTAARLRCLHLYFLRMAKVDGFMTSDLALVQRRPPNPAQNCTTSFMTPVVASEEKRICTLEFAQELRPYRPDRDTRH